MRTIVNSKQIPLPIDSFPQDEEDFCEKVLRFAREEVAPLVQEMDERAALDAGLLKKIVESGMMRIEIPKEYGGLGKSFLHTILAIEKLAETDPAVSVFVDVQNTLVINAIQKWGTDSQKEKFLTILADGIVGAFAITEEDSGSNATGLACHAVKVEGGFRLTGKKHWITNALEANVFIVFAKVSDGTDDRAKNAGLTAFVLDRREVTGFGVGKPEEKMGIRASSTCGVTLEGVFVPEDSVLGTVGKGLVVVLETLTDGRIGIGAQMLGLAQGAFNATIQHAKQRKQFDEYICTYQGVHFPIAQMATEIQAARLFIYNVSRMKMSGCEFKELMQHASMAKLYASQVADRVVSQCLDIMGGKGYMKGNPVEKLYRDAKIGTIYEGTSNIQLMTIARNYVKIK